jgi:hypothetical protein
MHTRHGLYVKTQNYGINCYLFLLKQDSEERKKLSEASSGDSSSDQTPTTIQSSSGLNEKAAISRAFDTLARAASSTNVRIFS